MKVKNMSMFYGWNLSTGNVITGVFINLTLVGIGIAVQKEPVSTTNIIGIILSIMGVALISIRPKLNKTIQTTSQRSQLEGLT